MVTDEELMSAYVDGDAKSFRSLFDRYAPVIQRVFERRVRPPNLAGDLVQQTFLQLHRARNDYRVGAPVRPWLMTIAFNLYREHYRKVMRHPEAALDALSGHEPAVDATGQLRADIRKDLQRALALLPDDQREVIVMHWFDGLSFGEIAELVGATSGAVRVRAHRGYEALRANLDVNGNGSAVPTVRGEE